MSLSFVRSAVEVKLLREELAAAQVRAGSGVGRGGWVVEGRTMLVDGRWCVVRRSLLC